MENKNLSYRFIRFTVALIVISAVIVGVCFVFEKVLLYLSSLAFDLFPYNLILLPFVGLVIIYFKNLKIESVAGSMGKVFRATQYNEILSILIIPFQITTTWLSHLAGASVGKEGVALQLGATVSNNIANRLGFDTRNFTSAGKAAGFAALFGTPLAGVFFAYEMNSKDIKDYKFWYSAVIMSFLSSYWASCLGVEHFQMHIDTELRMNNVVFIKITVIAIIFVLVGTLFAKLLKEQRIFYNKIFKNEYKKVFVLGCIYTVLTFLVGGRYMSLGTNLIDMSFNAPELILYRDFICKLFFTTYIISIGFQGGELTPLFSIGATLGVILGISFNLPIIIIAALGYCFVFGNATNAYLTSFLIAFEVFGISILPYALICLTVSYMFANKTSIYTLYWKNYPIVNA